jgi:hypothetical protein
MNPRIAKAEYLSSKKLRITFKNGECKIFDFSPYLQYPVYQPLVNESFCRKVKVINGTVCWDEDIDFDPDRVYSESVAI